jgi:hypothetical protein
VLGRERCAAVLDAIWRFEQAGNLAQLMRLIAA